MPRRRASCPSIILKSYGTGGWWLRARCWLAARCSSRLGPTTNWQFRVLAHTSPVYVRVPGQEVFSPEAAAYLLTLVEGAQTWVDTLATRPDPEGFERIRKTLAEAHDRLHRRLHDHGSPHSH